MNESPYVISGFERKALKKQLAHLKHLKKYNTYYNDVNEVMGGPILSPEAKQEYVKRINTQIQTIETKLKEKK